MSEKRFTGAVDSNGFKSIFDNESEDCNEPILFNCIGIVDEVVDLLNEQQATIENLRKWLIAEQKQVEKRDAFIKQKGLMREFIEMDSENYE